MCTQDAGVQANYAMQCVKGATVTRNRDTHAGPERRTRMFHVWHRNRQAGCEHGAWLRRLSHLSRGLHSSAPATPTPRRAHLNSASAAAHSHSDQITTVCSHRPSAQSRQHSASTLPYSKPPQDRHSTALLQRRSRTAQRVHAILTQFAVRLVTAPIQPHRAQPKQQAEAPSHTISAHRSR